MLCWIVRWFVYIFLGRVVENIDGVGDDSTKMLESSDGVVDGCKETGE